MVEVGHWQLLPGQLLMHHCWQEEYVLFNSLSGDTHLLGRDAMDLLLDLQDGPISAGEFDLDADGAGTRALLDRLCALGLVEAVPC